MEKRLHMYNFIFPHNLRQTGIYSCLIYLLLAVFLITGSGMGLGEGLQVFSSCNQESRITPQTFTTSNNLHIFEVREQNTAAITSRSMKGNRTESFYRNVFFFLCALALLSGIFRIVHSIFVFYGRLYIGDRYYMIAFMHDTDGRKRIA
ncbi:MAG: hypothetical protein ACI4A3_07480 [Lachnospiraceae bacterium]